MKKDTNTPKPKPLKAIEFLRCLTGCVLDTENAQAKPHDWDNVILLSAGNGYDLMFAWDNSEPNEGIVYIGHWNDGVK